MIPSMTSYVLASVLPRLSAEACMVPGCGNALQLLLDTVTFTDHDEWCTLTRLALSATVWSCSQFYYISFLATTR